MSKNWTLLGEMYEKDKPPKQRDCEKEGHGWVDLDVILHCRFCKAEKVKEE